MPNNKVRLPFKITRPQFPEERKVFNKADGSFKTMSAIVRKTYEGETDWFPAEWHERLKIALSHDDVTIEGDKYNGGVSQEGEYDILWSDFLDYPTAKARFKVNVTPFSATNNNCQICEEATQLSLEDDTFVNAYDEPLGLAEETEYSLDVSSNDSICCYPPVFSVTSFNSAYLLSAVIDQDGVLTIVTKTGLVDATNVLLVTYRVTCPNGDYDEADVFGNIDGSIEGCLTPENLAVDGGPLTPTSAVVTWEAPSPAPSNDYIWELYETLNPGAPVQSGTSPGFSIVLIDLTPGTDYTFYIKSDCGAIQSEFINIEFSTPVESETCGSYNLTYTDPEGISSNFASVTYLNCNSVYQNIQIYHGQTKTVCAQQTGPADPVWIESVDIVFIDYQGEC